MNRFILIIITISFISCQSNGHNLEVKVDTPVTVNSSTISSTQNPQKQNNEINETAVSSNSGTNCDGNQRAYEFGREMATMVKIGSSSLNNAIKESFEPLGLEPPFNSSNPCVIKGFEDASNNIPSPYNKEGKNWTTFK
jgi:hypothetical protein